MSGRLRTTTTVADIGEFGFLSALLPRLPKSSGASVGPGQDCAVIRCGSRDFLFTIDALVEGVHFQRDWMSPRQIGRKSFLVNASDIAAMGGRPQFCVVNLAVPASYRVRPLLEVQAGISSAAQEHGAAVVGGNLVRSEQLAICIALLGQAPKRIVTRQGARRGDRVYVTGTLGDAALGVQQLSRGRKGAAPAALRRFREPTPRVRAGRFLVASGIVSAMIDVSDGLVQDLGHVCEQSAVGAVIHVDRVPLSRSYRAAFDGDRRLALRGGEDYELLCTVPERNVQRLERNQARLGCSITCIGEITDDCGVRLCDADGSEHLMESTGHDHFRMQRG